MDFTAYTFGFGITGSFCTHAAVLETLRQLVETGAKVIPVFSYQTLQNDTRFGRAKDFVDAVSDICGHPGLRTISEAEPVGPKKLFDLMVIAPCTGNSLAKLTAGISDSPVLMAAKAHLRNQRPIVISVSSNDGLGQNFKNVGALMHTKHVYFVPFGQDDFVGKPTSLVADNRHLQETITAALHGRQLQPVLLPPR